MPVALANTSSVTSVCNWLPSTCNPALHAAVATHAPCNYNVCMPQTPATLLLSCPSSCQANPLVRAALEEQGEGRVLVVDGGASMRWVLVEWTPSPLCGRSC